MFDCEKSELFLAVFYCIRKSLLYFQLTVVSFSLDVYCVWVHLDGSAQNFLVKNLFLKLYLDQDLLKINTIIFQEVTEKGLLSNKGKIC